MRGSLSGGMGHQVTGDGLSSWHLCADNPQAAHHVVAEGPQLGQRQVTGHLRFIVVMESGGEVRNLVGIR